MPKFGYISIVPYRSRRIVCFPHYPTYLQPPQKTPLRSQPSDRPMIVFHISSVICFPIFVRARVCVCGFVSQLLSKRTSLRLLKTPHTHTPGPTETEKLFARRNLPPTEPLPPQPSVCIIYEPLLVLLHFPFGFEEAPQLLLYPPSIPPGTCMDRSFPKIAPPHGQGLRVFLTAY